MKKIEETANLVDIYSIRDGDTIIYISGSQHQYSLISATAKGDYSEHWTHRGIVEIHSGKGNAGGHDKPAVYMDSIIAINPNKNWLPAILSD